MHTHAFCPLAFVPLRKNPEEQSEMISQILFGELMTVLETNEKWTYVRLYFDGYEGYADTKMLTFIPVEEYERMSLLPKVFCNTHIETVDYEGEKIPVYMGATFYKEKDDRFSVNGKEYRFPVQQQSGTLVDTARTMLNVPYLWGGKLPFAVDCSGFTQLIFRTHGISILRDASQQAEMGEEVVFLENTQPGDLAFFGDEENISHVGMIINPSTIIHASGKVRIDTLDSQGIYAKDSGRHTHHLRFIKRIIP